MKIQLRGANAGIGWEATLCSLTLASSFISFLLLKFYDVTYSFLLAPFSSTSHLNKCLVFKTNHKTNSIASVKSSWACIPIHCILPTFAT